MLHACACLLKRMARYQRCRRHYRPCRRLQCVVNSTDGKRYPTAQFRPLLRVGAHFLDPNAAGDSYEQRKVIATAVHSGYIYRDRVNPVTDPFWVTEWNNGARLAGRQAGAGLHGRRRRWAVPSGLMRRCSRFTELIT